MASRYGSQALAEAHQLGRVTADGTFSSAVGRSESEVTWRSGLAGFAGSTTMPPRSVVAIPATESGVTCSDRLAGFESNRPRGGRNWTLASFKYAETVSRRTPVSRSIRRVAHPRRPKAMICCFWSSLKTLLTRTEDTLSRPVSMSWLAVYNWPVLR